MKRRVVERWWKKSDEEDCECKEKHFSAEIVSWLFHSFSLNSRVSDFKFQSMLPRFASLFRV
jgi:hypothetical protein